MLRFIIRRLAIIPVALLLIHFLGFGYAHLARPLRAARNPFFASLAVTFIFGLTFATLLTLVFVPVLYLTIHGVRQPEDGTVTPAIASR